MKFDHLPQVPVRPHTFFALDSMEVAVKLPERKAPLRIHCKNAGNGPPLLLIHGLMTSGYSFRYIVPALAAKFRVIVPDLPGAGRSEAPLDLSMSPRSMAQVILCLISALQIEPPYIVGNSLGGYQSLWFAVLFPGQVRKLVVMHAPGFPQFRLSALRFLLAFPGGRLLARRLIGRNPEGFAARNIHYYDPSIMSREEAREYGSIFRAQDRTEVFIRILRESLAPGAMRELAGRLAEIRGGKGMLPPVRLFWAREDAIVPPVFGVRYQELLPTAELIWFDRASHFLHVDDPERTVREIMRFAV
jgi:pimeloyl-ACP methyl ester carboxylesterase